MEDVCATAAHFQLSATSCHLQSLSLTVSREAPASLLNYLCCRELSEAISSDKGWVERLNPPQSGPFWQKPSFPSLGRKCPSSTHNCKQSQQAQGVATRDFSPPSASYPACTWSASPVPPGENWLQKDSHGPLLISHIAPPTAPNPHLTYHTTRQTPSLLQFPGGIMTQIRKTLVKVLTTITDILTAGTPVAH